MSSFNAISPDKLNKLIGTPNIPVIIDVRIQEDYSADPRVIPTTIRRPFNTVTQWASGFVSQSVVVICQRGAKLSQGVTSWLHQFQIEAQYLEGGFEAWKEKGFLLIPQSIIPPQDEKDRTVWVTRSRPKIDRVACPWLIRRFIDPKAVFLFVNPSEVSSAAERFGATAFDIENTFWSHRHDQCTFDVMLTEFGLEIEPLLHLARIIRAADTNHLELAPEASGLLAISLGLSRMFVDDLAQLNSSFLVYDALYRWCRDATDEKHSWPHHKIK